MDWRNRDPTQPDLKPDAPTLLAIHGLNGSSDEACILYTMVGVELIPLDSCALSASRCPLSPVPIPLGAVEFRLHYVAYAEITRRRVRYRTAAAAATAAVVRSTIDLVHLARGVLTRNRFIPFGRDRKMPTKGDGGRLL